MVIKSGEGVVILTRPKKYFHSSYHPQKTNLSFIDPEQTHVDPEQTQNICAQAHQNGRQFTQYGQFPKKKMK